ncbi:hypothetical protein Rhow_001597 [Rhodococcus wratislaviensis]|uniref:Uncharacterized protein n=1 Tax=Rhodococcus wratislaviensis TaxID=44752 RepID=A0A402BXW1_RHOWR|nr:hypothetical protein Rhow_001597 [Rhodococcus wratislaviensis]
MKASTVDLGSPSKTQAPRSVDTTATQRQASTGSCPEPNDSRTVAAAWKLSYHRSAVVRVLASTVLIIGSNVSRIAECRIG